MFFGWSRQYETGPMVFLDGKSLTQRARGIEWVIKTWNFIDKQAFFLVGGGVIELHRAKRGVGQDVGEMNRERGKKK